MLVETGFWPADIPFGMRELATVVDVMNNRAKAIKRASHR